jgi:hypothetical protein
MKFSTETTLAKLVMLGKFEDQIHSRSADKNKSLLLQICFV